MLPLFAQDLQKITVATKHTLTLVKVLPKLFTRNEELFLIIDHCKLADILTPVIFQWIITI